MTTPVAGRERAARPAGPDTPAGHPSVPRRSAAGMTDRRYAALLMLPAALFLAAFVAWPLVRLVVDSFYEISPISGGLRSFVGLANYATALGGEAFQGAARRTVPPETGRSPFRQARPTWPATGSERGF